MKKLANTIFGKESKYHHREGEHVEAVDSEKYHTKYDETAEVVPPVAPVAAVPVVPVVERKPGFEEKLTRELDIERRYREVEPARTEYIRTEEPIRTELREEALGETKVLPTVTHERVFPVEREEIQPIVHRDIEKTEIRLVTSEREEREVRPTLVREGVLPAEYRPEVRIPTLEAEERLRALEGSYSSTIERGPIEHKVYEKAPIIEETVHRRVIEEVQPIIHKETIEPVVIKEVRPIYEKVIEPPVIVSQVTRGMEHMRLGESHDIHFKHHETFLSGEHECGECLRMHRESRGICTFCRGPSYGQASYATPYVAQPSLHQHHHHHLGKGTPTGPATGSVMESRMFENRPGGPSY